MEVKQIIETHKEHLRNFIATKVSEDHVDDILQEVNLALVTQAQKQKVVENPESYIFQIARNKIADHYRNTKRVEEVEQQFTNNEVNYEPCVCDVLELVIQKLLPNQFSEPLILSDLHKTSQKDVASKLGLTYENAKSRIQRARKMFKTEVEKLGEIEYNSKGEFVCLHVKDRSKVPQDLLAVVQEMKLLSVR